MHLILPPSAAPVATSAPAVADWTDPLSRPFGNPNNMAEQAHSTGQTHSQTNELPRGQGLFGPVPNSNLDSAIGSGEGSRMTSAPREGLFGSTSSFGAPPEGARPSPFSGRAGTFFRGNSPTPTVVNTTPDTFQNFGPVHSFTNRFSNLRSESSSSTSTGLNAGTTDGSRIHSCRPCQTGSETPLGSSTGDMDHQLQIFRLQVEEVHQQMDRHFIPSAETLANLRLLQSEIIHDARRNPPSVSPVVLNRELEFLDGRISLLFERHENWSRGILSLSTSLNGQSNITSEFPRVYLARSPEGNQSLVVSLGTTAPALSVGHSALPPLDPTRTVPFTGPNVAPGGGGEARPNEAHVQNVVHQAVINQQRRQNEAANGGAGGHIRRIWLFVRLYFFIYMISESGTWTRIIFVTAAVLISLLSDSELPHQALRLLVNPMQRHLERLAVVDEPTEQPRPRAVIGDVMDYIWRAERSIVLLLASLVPGIGERQVQARSTAEAEAEQRRVEEERRQSDEQNVQQSEGQNAPGGQQEQEQGQVQEQSHARPQVAAENQPRATLP
ncbi:hypothetical protein N7478_012409 [Penicillium angulare]|uniref:uncharacterized protein n=1 Tax=Penicillium angulare TaxID=116970 RepID=UPI002540F26D|nr:uncharacterized protein N7478_012409 [Penicillium angulare]KAJ5259428.1 hypothetical protein N7478_012409 [Penicillium angulare]